MCLFAVVPIAPTLASLAPLLVALAATAVMSLGTLLRPRTALVAIRFLWRQKFALMALAGMAGVIAAAVVWRSSHSEFAQKGQAIQGQPWPAARGDLTRRGWADRNPGPTNGGFAWSAGRPGEAFYSSPAVVGDRVYGIGSLGDNGHIYAWDLQTGKRAWSTSPRGYRATFSSPVVSGRYLVCGEGLHHVTTARVICIDLSPENEGAILWTFATNSHVESTPIIDGDRIIVGAGDDGVYCLRLDPGVEEERRLIWHAPGERCPDAESSPAVHDGKVYVGLGEGGEAICVLDRESGEELARVAMPYPVFGTPAIADGKLYVGMGRGDYVHLPEHSAGQVCCLNLKSLQFEWTFQAPATVLDAIVAAEGELIFGCADGGLYILNRDGQLLRKWNSHAPVLAAPAVTSDTIYLVNRAGMLYGLDRRRLEPFWELRLGRDGHFISAPVVAGGRVHVGTGADGFACVGEPPTKPRQERIPSPIRLVASDSPASLSAVDRQSGAVLWRVPLDAAPTSAPVLKKNLIYITTAAGKETRRLVDGQRTAPSGRKAKP